MVHLILKKHLKVQKIFARWVTHLLTDEQNRQRDNVAKKMLQIFQSSLPMSSQVMKIGSIILSPSESLAIKSGPLNIADAQLMPNGLSARKVWYAIFFSGEGVAIKVPMKMATNITVKHYKDIVLEKPKNIISHWF